ncbi:hypothetical protein Nepgr_020123 [Nepenthes gracilis]|uniref:Uncharacterized protein n=1 Tax=Nepenthes gracilis TaxID=150966 RepID=A0AAD3XUQ9_NEPGR|nr:hypothetical protein Nepgr_020123 [Nepenthes gracilis]
MGKGAQTNWKILISSGYYITDICNGDLLMPVLIFCSICLYSYREKTLYRVWRTNLSLWDFVITKRIDLQKLQLELKLNLVLNEQLAYLEDWDLLERDHSTCLTG